MEYEARGGAAALKGEGGGAACWPNEGGLTGLGGCAAGVGASPPKPISLGVLAAGMRGLGWAKAGAVPELKDSLPGGRTALFAGGGAAMVV